MFNQVGPGGKFGSEGTVTPTPCAIACPRAGSTMANKATVLWRTGTLTTELRWPTTLLDITLAGNILQTVFGAPNEIILILL